jgi:hypothetical protein
MKKLSLSILVLMMCITLSFAREKAKSESCKNWEKGIIIGVANFTIRHNMVKEGRFNRSHHPAMNNLLSKNNIDRKSYWYSKIGVSASNFKGAVAVSPVNIERWKIPVIVPGGVVTVRRNDNLNLNIPTQPNWISTDRPNGHKTEMNAVSKKPMNSEIQISGSKIYTFAGI